MQTKAVFGEEIGAVIERGCADDNLQMNIPLDDGTNRTLEVINGLPFQIWLLGI